jgi:aerobic-type carbon monoxide dehydrogenase small subunit (CoxS/CutS family)
VLTAVALRPRLEELAVGVRVDGVDHVVTTWSDMSALEALRLVHPAAPSRCESGICGTCEVLLDGAVARICSLPARRLDGADVVTRR